MKKEILFALFLFSTVFSLNSNEIIYITFSNDGITTTGEGAVVSGTTVIIEKSGTYSVKGSTNEGNLIVKASSVCLYLHDLYLASKTTAPLTINSKLRVQVINIQNTTLKDLEDDSTTTGECAVIKIKNLSKVTFENHGVFTLYGDCKNVIKGEKGASIIFESSKGEYTITANKTAIASDGSLEFYLGKYTIVSKYEDAIKSSPEDSDTSSLGKIIIYNGEFKIQCYNDAFTAKKNITIVDGKFDIKTENGYESTTFDYRNQSAAGFKITNNGIGCEIKVYSAEMSLNTAGDAFNSNRDLTILKGKYIIYSKDDGVHAGLDLVLGVKDAPNEDLDFKVLYSYEAIEGMTVTVYSGKIVATAIDDGINASEKDEGSGNQLNPQLGFKRKNIIFRKQNMNLR